MAKKEIGKIIIEKYGGEDQADKGDPNGLEKMGKIASHVAELVGDGRKVVLVLSAKAGRTDELIDLGRRSFQLFGKGEPQDSIVGPLLAVGEKEAITQMTIILSGLGIGAEPFAGWQIGLEAYPDGRVKRVRNIEKIEKVLSEGKVAVVAGFQGVLEGTDEIMTLGRGGSDATALAIAARLGADRCEVFLYKKVDGIYGAPPDLVPNAIRFDNVPPTFLAHFASAGAKVVMSRAAELASDFKIPFRVKKSISIGESTGGTYVSSDDVTVEDMERLRARPAVAVRDRIVVVRISNILNQPGASSVIYGPLEEKKIPLVDIGQLVGADKAESNMLCTEEVLDYIMSELQIVQTRGVVGAISIFPCPAAQINLVTPLMIDGSGFAARIFRALGSAGINIESNGSGGNVIWVAVNRNVLKESTQAIAQEFDLVSQ